MSGGLILDLFGFPMGSPVPYRIASELPGRPPVTAGADEAEGVAPLENVTAEPVVTAATPDPPDDDRVKHATEYPSLGVIDSTGDPWVASRLRIAEGLARLREQGEKHYLPQAEFDRQARLRRWQAVAPERRT